MTAAVLTKNGRPRAGEHVGHNAVHTAYLLTCDEFDQLVIRSEGRCDRCSRLMPYPDIDHDYTLGVHAVRGFVCHPCNATIAAVERGQRDGDALTDAYLANPFYVSIPESLPGYRPPPQSTLNRRGPRKDQHLFTSSMSASDRVDLDGAADILGIPVDDARELAQAGCIIGLSGDDGTWLFRRAVVERVRELIAKGQLRGARIGTTWVFRRVVVKRFHKATGKKAEEQP